MLLSIVRSDNYKKFNGKIRVPEAVSKGSDLEWIGPVLGPSAAVMRNRGAQKANGKWLVFCDYDCEFNSEIIKEVLSKESYVDAVGGFYFSESPHWLTQSYCSIQNRWVNLGIEKNPSQRLPHARHLLGGALAIRRNVFESLGGFSEEMGWGAEETELISRLIKRGYRTTIHSDWKVNHENKMTWSGLFKRAWYQNYNHVRFNISDDSVSLLQSFNYLKGPSIEILPKLFFFGVAISARIVGLIFRGKR